MRKLFVLPLFLQISLSWTTLVKADSLPLNTVIINQIRGGEICCQSGTSEMVEQITNNPKYQSIPIHWAIRFDALTDPDFLTVFNKKPSTHVLGLLLEVTPKLARESGVEHKFPANANWSEARHAFLVGYLPAERQKILDTLFNKFYEQFGYYPSFTVGWLIDSWSLNYIRSKYGVRVHEITKEQFETDGYTLYGGIFNLPYFPILSHPLIPGSSANKLDLLILRQTVSDIDKNYGSAQSIYTSQPNDYLSQKPAADFTYLQKLISEMQKQSQMTKIAVLGLENSQEWTLYKNEYFRQLDYLQDLADKKEIIFRNAYDLYQLVTGFLSQSNVRFLQTSDFPGTGKLWYFGSKYRALIEIWDSRPVLTDLRIYADFSDPYMQIPASSSQAYWIIPYLLDSSQQFIAPQTDLSPYRGDPVRADAAVNRFGIKLSESSINQINQSETALTLVTDNGSIIFSDEGIVLENTQPKFLTPVDLTFDEIIQLGTEKFIFFRKHPRFFLIPDHTKIKAGWESKQLEQVVMANLLKQENKWLIKPNLDLNQIDMDKISSIFQPDRSDYTFDPSASIFFWHNTQAIAGRNAVRLYLNPLNILKRSAQVNQIEVRLTDAEEIDYLLPPLGIQEPFFIDFTADRPAKSRVNLLINGNLIGLNQEIVFVPDCFKKITLCLKDRDQIPLYLSIRINELKQFLDEKAKNIIEEFQTKAKIFLEKAKY